MTIDFNPGAGGTQRLPRAVGVGRALQMMLEGRSAEPARRRSTTAWSGAVVPPEQVKEAAVRIGERLARRSPAAIRLLEARGLRGRLPAAGPGLGVERKWFMVASATDSSQREDGHHDRAGRGRRARSPWATADGLLPWQEGVAAEVDRAESLAGSDGGAPGRPHGSAAGRSAAPSAASPAPGGRSRSRRRRAADRWRGWDGTAGEEAPGPLQPVLPAGQAGPGAADVLEEEQPAALDQHPARLGERRARGPRPCRGPGSRPRCRSCRRRREGPPPAPRPR